MSAARNSARLEDLSKAPPFTCVVVGAGDERKAMLSIPVPAAKKNRQQIHRRGAKLWIAPSEEARVDERRLAAMIDLALTQSRIEELFGEDDVEARGVFDVAAGEVRIEFRRIGPVPVQRSWRGRDLSNFLETVFDAVQSRWKGKKKDRRLVRRGLFRNDKQVARIVFERVYPHD